MGKIRIAYSSNPIETSKRHQQKLAFVFCNKTQQVNIMALHIWQTSIQRARRDVFRMGRDQHQPPCMVAHDLVNKLSVIISHCDLLLEITERETEYAMRLALIRSVADTAAKELAEHQRQLAAEMRESDGLKTG